LLLRGSVKAIKKILQVLGRPILIRVQGVQLQVIKLIIGRQERATFNPRARGRAL